MNNPTNKTLKEILDQVITEYESSANFTNQKREVFRENFKLLMDKQGNKKKKVNDHMILTAIKQKIAISYTDKVTVSFEPREIGDAEKAQNWNDLAEFDQYEMGLDAMNYDKEFNKHFYGVSIRMFDAWNADKMNPEVSLINPMSWYPDPNGHLEAKNFSFMGFEVNIAPRKLTKGQGFFDTGKIKNVEVSNNQKVNRDARITALGYSDSYNAHDENALATIYHHLTRIDGQPYMITTANNNQVVIRISKIEAADSQERKNPDSIPFPVVLNYFDPIEGDPFGNNMCDYLADKQKARSTLRNLRIITEKIASLGGDVLYNADSIRNPAHLAASTTGMRYIPVNGDVNSAMREKPRPSVNPDSFNVQQDLERQAAIESGSSPLKSGVVADERRTAEEIRTATKNSDLLALLDQRIDMIGERQFWRLYMRSYKMHMPTKTEKQVRIRGHFYNPVIKFMKDDFVGSTDPDITVEHISNIKESNAEFLASYPALYQQATTNIAKAQLQRLYARKIGLTRDEVKLLSPPSPEEIQAQDDVLLINDGEFPEIMDQGEDHRTYIVIYQQANDSPVKERAINARMQALIVTGQNQIQQSDPKLQQQAEAIQQASLTNNLVAQ